MSSGNDKVYPADGLPSASKEKDDMFGNNAYANDPESSTVLLDQRVQAQLGRQLSAYYTDLIKQPIPDKFIELLMKLEKSESGE